MSALALATAAAMAGCGVLSGSNGAGGARDSAGGDATNWWPSSPPNSVTLASPSPTPAAASAGAQTITADPVAAPQTLAQPRPQVHTPEAPLPSSSASSAPTRMPSTPAGRPAPVVKAQAVQKNPTPPPAPAPVHQRQPTVVPTPKAPDPPSSDPSRPTPRPTPVPGDTRRGNADGPPWNRDAQHDGPRWWNNGGRGSGWDGPGTQDNGHRRGNGRDDRPDGHGGWGH